MPEDDIKTIKNHLFYKKHDLGDRVERFDPSYRISQTWQHIAEGKKILDSDRVLINHELLEIKLMSEGMSQDEAYIKASGEYNYLAALKKDGLS